MESKYPKRTESINVTRDMTPKEVMDSLCAYAGGHDWLPDKRGQAYSYEDLTDELAVLGIRLAGEGPRMHSEVFKVRRLSEGTFQIEYIEPEGLPPEKTIEEFVDYLAAQQIA